MMHHHNAIACQLHVQFRAIAAARQCVGKGRQAILRHQLRAAAMGDVPDLHGFL